MRYISIILLFSFIACSSDKNSRKDRRWLERNTFMENAVFRNKSYQENQFSKYEGLWACVREERNRDKKVITPKYSDLLFAEGKAWMIDYPCSWNMQGFTEDVHFRNDSIFFSTKDRVYIEKKKIEFRKDTLVIFGTNDYDESHYYLRKQYDSITLSELKAKEFNRECITGKWSLNSITDGNSGEWQIKDGFHSHVPREINFDTDEMRIEGVYLITSDQPNGKFEIIQYDRHHDSEVGEQGFLYVKELNKRNGIEHHYDYELQK